MGLFRKQIVIEVPSQIPDLIKTTAESSDYVLLADGTNTPYKITKTNLLADFSGGSNGGGGSSGSGGGSSGNSDTLFSSVTLLLQGIDANGSTTFTDSSNSNKVPTIVGNPIISTANSRFSTSAIYLNGSSALDYNPGIDTTTDWTIDLFFNGMDLGTTTGRVLFEMRPPGGNGNYPIVSIINGTVNLYQNNDYRVQTGAIIASNTWYYFGLKSFQGITSLWLNGSQIGSYNSGGYGSLPRFLIGKLAYDVPSTYFFGYISPIRVTNAARDLSKIPTNSFPAN